MQNHFSLSKGPVSAVLELLLRLAVNKCLTTTSSEQKKGGLESVIGLKTSDEHKNVEGEVH